MTAPNTDGAPSDRLPWIFFLVVGVIAILALVDLVAQVNYSMSATREVGTITAVEGGIGRRQSVFAQASVVSSSAAPISVEIEDTLGIRGWKEGDSVPLLCTRLHADHVSCVFDSFLQRYWFPLTVLVIGGALVWLRLRHKRRLRAGAVDQSRAG